MDDNALREFVERLLWRDISDPSAEVELLLGRLPEDLPVTVPLRAGWRVVGSTSTDRQSHRQYWTVVLDAPGTIPDMSEVLQDVWKEQNWKINKWPAFSQAINDTGFLPDISTPGMGARLMEWMRSRAVRAQPSQLMLCRDSVRLTVTLATRPLNRDIMDVHLAIHKSPDQRPCNEAWPVSLSPVQDLVPRLYPPAGAGVSVASHGRSSSTHSSSIQAAAITNMTAQALATHYEKQLEALGWTKLEGEAVESMAWSKWSIPYENKAQGYIHVIQGLQDHTKLLFLQVDIDAVRPFLSSDRSSSTLRWLVGDEPPGDEGTQANDAQNTKDEGA